MPTTSVSEDNVKSLAEKRLDRLEEKHLNFVYLKQKYGHLLEGSTLNNSSIPRGRPARAADVGEFRNGITSEPLPENVIPMFKPGIETNGYKA